MEEIRLAGGFVNDVVRVGETVRRSLTGRSGFVHALLEHFERRGWGGAPRFLGVDEQGREVLSYLPGDVPWEPERAPWVSSDKSLVRVAELVREFHDLTAGTELAGDEEVVCHNDLSPKNTVYEGIGEQTRPVAFIDWDIAAPGARVHDVAHVCWQYLDLGPSVTDVAEAGRRIRLISDAYGLEDRDGLVETILWWQDRCWRGIESSAADGDPAMIRLAKAGVVVSIRNAAQWVSRHRRELEDRLR
ncbi:phosphotransferase [Sphaerisporangium sp. NPDC051017]|uniref:phosphotransferase n=1 Tax=Sphaerisporangium sp. NPDC051017 TaxID=3154636 RepID=UPI0034462BF4